MRPTPRTVPWPGVDVEDERLGELGPDVERGAGGEGLLAVTLPDPPPEGHQAPVSSRDRPGEGRRPQPLAPRPAALGHRRPAATAAVDRRHRGGDELAGRDAAATRSSETVTNSCGSAASRASATTPEPRARHVAGRGLERMSIESYGSAADTSRTPGATSSAPATSSPGFGSPAAPPALSRRFVSRSSSWRAAIRSGTASSDWAPMARRPASKQREPLADQGVGAGAGDGLDPAHAGADAPLAGDQEAADLAGRPAVRAAAQLEAVVLDADRPNRLAVLLVEERVRAALDRLGHAHECDGDGSVVADDAVDLVLDGPQLVVRQAAIEREVEAQVVRRHQRAGLAGPLPDHVAQGPVEQVRAGVVAHRVGAALRVDDCLNGLAHAQPSVEVAAMDDQAAHRLVRVDDGEQLAPSPVSRRLPWSPTWPPPSA